MSRALHSAERTLADANRAAIGRALERIAPQWPLDRLVAASPYWGLRDLPFAEAAARLAALGGIQMLPTGEGEGSAPEEAHWHGVADLLDAHRDPHRMAWCDEIVHQVSQFCAAHYQSQRPLLHRHGGEPAGGLYGHWLAVTRRDRGIAIVMAEPALPEQFRRLPECPETLVAEALEELAIGEELVEWYAHGLLLDLLGWASYVAYRHWQSRLDGVEEDDRFDLLAIRMAWDLAIWRHLRDADPREFRALQKLWGEEKEAVAALVARHRRAQARSLKALVETESRYFAHLAARLEGSPAPGTAPRLCAVFCIDVRSEPLRRALEAQDPSIETRGFAGFFGLPIRWRPLGGAYQRPQLPGLLAAELEVVEALPPARLRRRLAALNRSARWRTWTRGALSAFPMVEAVGLGYAFKIARRLLAPPPPSHPVDELAAAPGWRFERAGQSLSAAERAALARQVLDALQLEAPPPLVLLVGHASRCTNNLHAAGLACGACGGQSGEVNVRALAALLNDPEVRDLLAKGGRCLGESRFVPALHDTVSEEVAILDGEVPVAVRDWLAAASRAARRDRVRRLEPHLASLSDRQLAREFARRGRDWSEVRPEWGLAGNAAFIAAPRAWTRGLDLEGRVFLHDYDASRDADYRLLETLLTAPLVVAHWINMQYNAAVTDPRRLGSGNKVLHNAVGGHIGVFEGNGGDLRVGLPLQSVHDGHRFVHPPQRLFALVAAPAEAIRAVVARHRDLALLVEHEWLYLLRWERGRGFERIFADRSEPFELRESGTSGGLETEVFDACRCPRHPEGARQSSPGGASQRSLDEA
ncbi:MAG: UPF0753 protein [Porticoccaceae bacterium]|nr:MAG: UPF0753 protein [Porticoccaceae bacterium]